MEEVGWKWAKLPITSDPESPGGVSFVGWSKRVSRAAGCGVWPRWAVDRTESGGCPCRDVKVKVVLSSRLGWRPSGGRVEVLQTSVRSRSRSAVGGNRCLPCSLRLRTLTPVDIPHTTSRCSLRIIRCLYCGPWSAMHGNEQMRFIIIAQARERSSYGQ